MNLGSACMRPPILTAKAGAFGAEVRHVEILDRVKKSVGWFDGAGSSGV